MFKFRGVEEGQESYLGNVYLIYKQQVKKVEPNLLDEIENKIKSIYSLNETSLDIGFSATGSCNTFNGKMEMSNFIIVSINKDAEHLTNKILFYIDDCLNGKILRNNY